MTGTACAAMGLMDMQVTTVPDARRVLFEVASLEKQADVAHESCVRHLAAAVRAARKAHGFAGGFDAEHSELFDKVR